jgi:hypothetical protein
MATKKSGKDSRAKRHARTQRVLFYRTIDLNGSTLVFASPDQAVEHDQIHRALVESKTWRQFRQRMPRKEYARLCRENPELRDYADDDEFAAGDIPGVEDAEYPWSIAGIQHSVLPSDLLAEFATHKDAFNCSGWWHIAPERKDELLAALRDRGIKVVERKNLEFY